MKSSKRIFIEKYIDQSNRICPSLEYDDLEEELLEAIEVDNAKLPHKESQPEEKKFWKNKFSGVHMSDHDYNFLSQAEREQMIPADRLVRGIFGDDPFKDKSEPTVPDSEEESHWDSAHHYTESIQEQINSLVKRVEELEGEDNTGRTFELTRDQLDKYNVWATKYLAGIRKKDTKSTVRFSFVFSDTGIGVHASAVCSWDNHTIDLTDYSKW